MELMRSWEVPLPGASRQPHLSYRGMLPCGSDNQVADPANMDELNAPNQAGKPAYEGVLNKRLALSSRITRKQWVSHLHGRQMASRASAEEFPQVRGFGRFSILS